MDANAKWVEGWFTRPGWFWCATTKREVELARVVAAANAWVCITNGGFRFEDEITHWLDEEVVPPALPVEIEQEAPMPSNAKVAVKPCPFCGDDCVTSWNNPRWVVSCARYAACGYKGATGYPKSEAVAAHNRVALAVELHGELVEALELLRLEREWMYPHEARAKRIDALLARVAQSPTVEAEAEGGSDE